MLLKISLSDYQRLYGEAGLAGRLRVGVQAEAKGTKPLAFQKEILPIEAAVTVEMAMNFPAPGHYRIKVDVEDLLSNHRVRAEKEIEILPSSAPLLPEHGVDEEPMQADLAAVLDQVAKLDAVLDKAAGYCRKLKEAAFRFYCLEQVEEKTLDRDPMKQQVMPVERRWEYDYQIIGANGEIREKRRLVREGTRKVDKENASLATRFSSRYSVFMPVTLLAAENRGKYRYLIAGHKKLQNRDCLVVDVQPRDPNVGEIAQGMIWIDEADGSVLKIAMSPRGVVGIQALKEAARKMSAELVMEVIHWYLVDHDGLRFPSQTEFIEQYRFDKALANRSQIDVRGYHPSTTVLETRVRLVEFYRLNQLYEDYRFFAVQSREEIKDSQ